MGLGEGIYHAIPLVFLLCSVFTLMASVTVSAAVRQSVQQSWHARRPSKAGLWVSAIALNFTAAWAAWAAVGLTRYIAAPREAVLALEALIGIAAATAALLIHARNLDWVLAGNGEASQPGFSLAVTIARSVPRTLAIAVGGLLLWGSVLALLMLRSRL
jgi:hypothetical protein